MLKDRNFQISLWSKQNWLRRQKHLQALKSSEKLIYTEIGPHYTLWQIHPRILLDCLNMSDLHFLPLSDFLLYSFVTNF